MKTFFSRLTGTLLILDAIGGLVFSVAGISGVWKYKDSVTEGIVSSLELIKTSLTTTAQGLVIVNDTISTLAGSIDSIQETLLTTVDTIESTKPMMDTLQSLMDTDLPTTVTAVLAGVTQSTSIARIDMMSVVPVQS